MAPIWRYRLLRGLVAGLVLTLGACSSIKRPGDADGLTCDSDAPGHCEPLCDKDRSMMALARDLDHLEKHIDWYGSATAKAPDVWGQARLTKYRDEIETQLSNDLGGFTGIISGSTARADQSYLYSALSLGLATGGAAVPQAPIIMQQAMATAADGKPDTEAAKTVQPSRFPASVTPLARTVADTTQFGSALAVDSTTKAGFAAVGLEPVEYLAQKNRYLNYLAQIRRTNEGDDTADSPGYSLNLMRIPVSVLPGKRTDTGHGAEVTMTVNPVLSDELLPATFRNLVTADLVKELGFPLTKLLDGGRDEFDSLTRLAVRNPDQLEKLRVAVTTGQPADAAQFIMAYEDALKTHVSVIPLRDGLSLDADDKKAIAEAYSKNVTTAGVQSVVDSVARTNPAAMGGGVGQTGARWKGRMTSMAFAAEAPATSGASAATKAEGALAVVFAPKGVTPLGSAAPGGATKIALSRIGNVGANISMPFSNGTRERQSMPFSQYLDVFGEDFFNEVAFQANIALRDTIDRHGYAHLPDVQGFLQTELDAAYRLLRMKDSVNLWQAYCSEEIVRLVRTRNANQLAVKRAEFRDAIKSVAYYKSPQEVWVPNRNKPDTQSEHSSTAALAWMILVHSALLNDRLILDMKETASHKQTALPLHCDWPDFYLPEPSSQARCTFNEYVKLRWPVKIFALDPANDEQNLADSLSTRRETQLALAVAFAAGNINGRTFNQFARKLDADYQTIDLNRTQVGFSHGENVFGWRFYPRFQTPDTKSNLSVLVRDQLIGGPSKDRLVRQRHLEPGMRECTALVIMPSFVPYLTLDVTTNWFGLTNPKHKVLDHTQALKLSQRVKAISTQGPCVDDSCKYRDGDQARLINRAEQLAARLPMQTLGAQVPVEANLGGFELFVNGTSDFAPELYGFYGAPGIDPNKTEVTLFLVGNHFSVTQSRVIIGNAEVKTGDFVPFTPPNAPAGTSPTIVAASRDVKVISRQVMQVKVPANAIAYRDPTNNNKPYINIHVATPYGVTREIAVPVVGSVTVAAPTPLPNPADFPAPVSLTTALELVYEKTGSDAAKFSAKVNPAPQNAILQLKWPTASGPAPAKANAVLEFSFNGCPLKTEVLNNNANELNYDPFTGAYTLNKTQIDAVIADINKRVLVSPANVPLVFDADTNPLKGGTFEMKATLVDANNPVPPATEKRKAVMGKAATWKFTCAIK